MKKMFMFFLLALFIPLTAIAQTPLPYSMLDPKPYDPENDPDIDMFIGNWKDSMPQKTHGALIERDILTKGDPLKPPRNGTVLKYVNRFTRASLGAGETTTPVTLHNEQEILYILSGAGTLTSGMNVYELKTGIAVLIPAELEFTLKNTGTETITMFLLNEPIARDFRPNKSIMIVDENKQQWNEGNPHWVGCSKQLFNTWSGLGTLESVITVQLDPMTFFHPHSHVEGTEEVWTAITDNVYVLLGKHVRFQPPGTGYLIPPNGITHHANFNISEDRIKLFYFSRFRDHETRK